MERPDIRDLARDGLEKELGRMGEPRYRAAQVFRWLYRSDAHSFDEMSDLSAGVRQKLKSEFRIGRLSVSDSMVSSLDGTARYLLKLRDANTIEAVFLPEQGRATICLSSQVGCKYGCAFCASASLGFVRNLTQSEITGQVSAIKRANPSGRITNLVFMGIGEPLDNYDNVLAAVRVFNDRNAFCIGARKMTISTCGIIPGIERLSREGLQVELSVSLHAADNALRSRIVPANKKYPLKDLISACKNYVKKTGRVITFEYVLIKDVNSSRADAETLAGLLKGINCKVNTISYNKVSRYSYSGISAAEAKAFCRTLAAKGINVISRRPRGEDIDAGCGQLRISRMAR